MVDAVRSYGPFPPLDGIRAENLMARLVKDKKTIQGSVHFVLATGIGATEVVGGIEERLVREAVETSLA
jgi:3-dehydroquinate synthetase